MSHPSAKMLMRADVRSNYNISALVLQFMVPGDSTRDVSRLLDQISKLLFRQRDLLVKDERSEQVLLMRKIKTLFGKQFGYNRHVT
jgi:hypothetical protein